MIVPSLQYASRILRTADTRHLGKFMWNFGVKGTRSVQLFKKRMKKGVYFPPFIYISVLNSCNLRCQGCWVDVDKPQVKIDLENLNSIVNDAKSHGNSFFGILGGEPMMHPDLFDFFAQHPDCFFQLFTNGQMITDKKAKQLRQLGNVTPLVSIEGTEDVANERRGGKDVLNRTLRGLDNCINNKILTGVATSLCQTNIDDLLTEEWLRKLIKRGVHYAWYHTYRPVGPQIHEELALTPEQARRVRQFVVDMRMKLPLGIIDAYYDGEGKALCPMATGISHHISPTGAIEPCPIIQFATENVKDTDSIFESLTGSEFMRDFRQTAAKHTRGCMVLERPDLVKLLAEKHNATDTTLRKQAMAEIESMTPRNSQWLPDGSEIPERNPVYRIAKRILFNDFGAYEELDASAKQPNVAGKS
ncbi:radical SAM protein [Verrucomicrobiales bacterium]|nr:radical SAM protein [Verrucomicrobiales bacterium]MDC0321820.1 radical SAM protein [Verrucomicrobiales bacterium]